MTDRAYSVAESAATLSDMHMMRYAALTGAPAKSLLTMAQAQACGLIAKVAAPYRTAVHVQAGNGDAALLQRILVAVAAARHGPAVVLADQAAQADVAITVNLPAERVEQTLIRPGLHPALFRRSWVLLLGMFPYPKVE